MDKIIPFIKKKGVGKMSTAILKEEKKSCGNMAEIKRIIQKSMRENKISSTEARKSLGIRRYEKKI